MSIDPTIVLIIGGGLGGLALAQLLLQSSSSIKVLIFERDENYQSRDQGYCIGIDPTGLEVLNKIQALKNLLADDSDSAFPISYFKLVNIYFRKLVQFNAKGMKLIYREDLRRALLTNLDVQWKKRFLSYKIVDDGIEANFEDGTTVHGTILIGCDGAKSLVRTQLIPDFKRDDLRVINVAGSTNQIEDLTKIQEVGKDSLVRIFGKQGHSLLILPIRQSWMWSLSWPEKGEHEEQNFSSNRLIEKAQQYFQNDEVLRLLERSSSSPFLGPYRLYSAPCLKQNPFPNNPRITLLGDSAHPMTTQAGKGANTAFADADDLANLLLNPSSSTLAKYQEDMFKRGYAAVKLSLSSTNMIHVTGWRALLRDSIFFIIRYTMSLIDVISLPFRWYKKKND